MARWLIAAVVLAAGLAPSLAEARFSIGAGDLIWSDGQSFTYDEWEEYKKTHPENGSAPKAPAAAPQEYQQQAAPPAPAYQPQYQTQAPPTASVVNGHPVVTIAPPPVSAPLPIQGAPTVTAAAPAAVPTYTAAPAAAAPALRAASCRTLKSYPEFPGDTEKFDCGAAGSLTRQEMAAQGWHTDFIEKVPSIAGQASPNFYKIILSR